MIRKLTIALSLPLLFAGCSADHNWISAPKVPTPVLLGPVDRVGGHRVSSGKVVGALDQEALDQVTSTKEDGKARETHVSISDSAPISKAVSSASRDRLDVDVHVDRLTAGGYVFLAGGNASLAKWVGVRGRAVAKAGAR